MTIPVTDQDGNPMPVKDLINRPFEERYGRKIEEAEFAISKSDFMRLIRGDMLMYGPLRRVVTLRDGPFVIMDEDTPVRRLKAPTPSEFVKVGPTPIEVKAAAKAKGRGRISIQDPTLKDRIRTVLKSFVDGVYKLVGRGGPGSGHHKHEGRPGEVGGSLPSNGAGGKWSDEKTSRVMAFIGEEWSPTGAVNVKNMQYNFWVAPDGRLIQVSKHSELGEKLYKRFRDDEFTTEDQKKWERVDNKELKAQGFVRTNFHSSGAAGKPVLMFELDRDALTSEVKEAISTMYWWVYSSKKGRPNIVLDWEDDDGKWHSISTSGLTGLPSTIKDINREVGFKIDKSLATERGGPGSGHHGHRGRTGEVGGSMPSGVGTGGFAKIVQIELKDAKHRGEFDITNNQAKVRAAQKILEGFFDFEEAEDAISTLEETGNLFFTGMGYEVNPDTLRQAVEFGKDWIYWMPNHDLEATQERIEATPDRTLVWIVQNGWHGATLEELERVNEEAIRRELIERGGPGSGHHEHEGRPGEVGGSKPSKDGGSLLSTSERRSKISEVIKRGLHVEPWSVSDFRASFWFLPDGSIHVAENGHWNSARRAMQEIGLDTDILMRELGVEYLATGEAESAEQGVGIVPILEMLRLGFGRLVVNKNTENITIQIDQPMTTSQKSTLLDLYAIEPTYDVFYDVNTVEQYQGPTENYRSGCGRREFNRLMGIVERIAPVSTPRRDEIESKSDMSVEVRGALRRIFIQSARHSRSKCMECDKAPVVAAHWADGRGMAWFCFKHFKEWIKEDDREIVGVWVLEEGECPDDIRKTPPGTEKVRKLGERISIDKIISLIDALIKRGGPGSGHHEHKGRPGEVGGSQPSRGAGAAKPKSGEAPPVEGEEGAPAEDAEKRPDEAEGEAEEEVSGGDIQAEVKRVADERVSEAQEIEPELTSTLGGIAEQFGGETTGLEYAVKSPESLARKIRTDMIEKGISAEEAEAAISDANRYTMLFDSEGYVDQVLQVQTALEEQGWEKYDHKWKNYFRAGDAYDGYNTVMVNPSTGQRFELQFHTPESIEIKNQVHKHYEELRVLSDGESQRGGELQAIMRESWANYQKPGGWERLPGVLK